MDVDNTGNGLSLFPRDETGSDEQPDASLT